MAKLSKNIAQLVSTAKTKIATLQGKSVPEPLEDLLDPHIPLTLRAGLTKSSQEKLNDLEQATYTLLEAVTNVQRWLDQHQQRARRIELQNTSLDCTASTVPPLSEASPGAARTERGVTLATPSSSGSPPSGTPLPVE